MESSTYREAGVDLDLYRQSMQRIPALVQRTLAPHESRVMPLPGGFAGLFRLNSDQRTYKDPVLVSGTDGVGTKLKVAAQSGRLNTVGIDLVAMCVNDCLCLGAEPLFFLDYLSLGRDNPDRVADLVAGVSEGCVRGRLALIGGETAIMPDVYGEDDFDLAGFSVGVAERTQLIDGEAIQQGDVVLGLASSGFHSNGFSLIRKVVFDKARLSLTDEVPELNRSIADVLLEPTRIYVDPVVDLLTEFGSKVVITGIAHITGGGLVENVERILPEDRRITLRAGSWDIPAEFHWLQELGHIDDEEMQRVFNMGIGMVLIVRPGEADSVQEAVSKRGIPAWVIGQVREGQRSCQLK